MQAVIALGYSCYLLTMQALLYYIYFGFFEVVDFSGTDFKFSIV